jgi:hypothetical protein
VAERFTAAKADIEFRAETGTARANVEGLRRDFRSATAAMSSDTLKLAVAQEKLDKALIRHGPASTQAKQAELAYRREVDASTASVKRQDAALDSQQRELAQSARAAHTAGGAFRGMGRSVALAASAYIGATGLVYAIKSTVDAAEESQQALTQTRTAVELAGLSWQKYGKDVEGAAAQLSKLSGFDDEVLLRGFSTLVRSTKDVTEALRLNALAVDVARGANIEYETALKIVLRASSGQARGLVNIGVAARKGADGVELLRVITEKFSGSAARATDDAAVAQQRFGVAVENVQEALGSRYLPAITAVANQAADWLNDERNQERVMRDVNAAVDTGVTVVTALSDAVDTLSPGVERLVGALGGLENAVKAALGVYLLRRFGLLRLGIQSVGTSALVAQGQIAAMGTAATVASGKVSTLSRLTLGINPAALAILAAIPAAQYLHERFDEPNTITKQQLLDPATRKRIEDAVGKQGLAKLDAAVTSEGLTSRPDEGSASPGSIARAAASAKPAAAKKPPKYLGLTVDEEIALSRAENTAGTSDEEKLLRAYIDRVRRAERDKRLGKDELLELVRLEGRLNSELQTIIDQRNAANQAAADKRAAAVQAAAEKQQADEARRRQKLVDAVNRAGVTSGPYATTGSGFDKAGVTAAQAARASAKAAAADTPTAADIAAAVQQALTQMASIQQRYAPNLQTGDPGMAGTRLYELVHETRRSNDHLEELVARNAFPASAYAVASAGDAQ